MTSRIVFCAIAALQLAGCGPPAPASAPDRTAQVAASAAPPATDIFLVDLTEEDGNLRVGTPRNLTDRDGYDNQPAFTPDGAALLFTSVRDGDQADIYRFEIGTGAATRVTRTPESEYSPTPLPAGGFSAVRVEMDSTQRLWRFAADGSDPRLVLTEVRPVGYHAWADEHTLALFVLGTPPTLRLADTRTGLAETVASDIGRSLNRVPGRRAISYVQKGESPAAIHILDLETRRSTRLAPTIGEAEDHAWTPEGTLLMADGSQLYRWDAPAAEWRAVADLARLGIRGITRIAVSPRGDRLALVAARGP